MLFQNIISNPGNPAQWVNGCLSKTYTKFNPVLYSTHSVAFGECSFRSGLHNDGRWESEYQQVSSHLLLLEYQFFFQFFFQPVIDFHIVIFNYLVTCLKCGGQCHFNYYRGEKFPCFNNSYSHGLLWCFIICIIELRKSLLISDSYAGKYHKDLIKLESKAQNQDL